MTPHSSLTPFIFVAGEVSALGMNGDFVAVAVWGGEGCTLYEHGGAEREIGRRLRDVRGLEVLDGGGVVMGLAVGDVVVETPTGGRKTFNVGTIPVVLSPFAAPAGEGVLKFYRGSVLASCPGSGKSPRASLVGSVGGQIARVDLALQPNDLKEVRVCVYEARRSNMQLLDKNYLMS